MRTSLAVRSVVLLVLAAAGCSHASSHETVRQAKRADIRALLGDPSAEDLLGELEVWTYFYDSSGGSTLQSPQVQKVDPQHDGLILSFDREGTLQHYYVLIAGRQSGRGQQR